MIFAAGLGTRLAPITEHTPKAMVSVSGKPVIQHVLDYLSKQGIITDVIINVHHFSEQIIAYLGQQQWPNLNIVISDESKELLDTGGGLKKASWFLDGNAPFLVYNVDVLTNLNIKEMLSFHQEKKGLATLATQNRPTSRPLLFDQHDILCGWANRARDVEKIIRPVNKFYEVGFSGIHIIEPHFLKLISEKGVFSIMEPYLRLAKDHQFYSFQHNNNWWTDIGTHNNLKQAESFLK